MNIVQKFIFALYFHFLPLAAHFQFFKRLSGFIAAAGDAVKAALASLMSEFNAALAEEEAVQQWVEKSALTEHIAEADQEIDRLLVGINKEVEAGLHSFGSAIVESARRVQIMLKSYGRIASESYDREEGDVRALIANLTGDYAHDVDNLGIGMWVQYLQLALTKFENLLLQREDEQLAKPPYTARQARRRLEKVYYMMKSTVEVSAATASAEVVGAFTAFIDKLNADIERLNTEFHRAKKDLGAGDHTVIEPIPTQTYTEQPITPVPTVYYREDETKPVEKLWLGKDFEVTYKNNVKVGMAELTVHGKGRYTGQATVKFNIARKPTPTEES